MTLNKQNVAGLILLVVVAGVVVWLAVYFSGLFGAANPSVQAAIVAGFIGLLSVTLTVWRERAKAVKEAHREKKIEVYSKFYDLMFSMLRQAKEGVVSHDLADDPMFKDSWYAITRGVLFYGSPKVVKAFSRITSEAQDGDPKAVMSRMGSVLLAMREDIGLSNFGLNDISVHQIYVNEDLGALGK